MTKKNIPIGIDLFAELQDAKNNYLYVDKSLFIKEVIEDEAKIILIIRPRRWGKTLNMSMLECFLAPEVYGTVTQGMFDSLAIAKQCDAQGQCFITQYQGQYPVIFITFKDVRQNSFEDAVGKVKLLIQELYFKHLYLLKSEQLLVQERALFEQYIDLTKIKDMTQLDIETAIKTLSFLLFKHYNQRVYILIDEYDTPLNFAFSEASPEYAKSVSNFMRNIFSATLKTNPYLEKGIITGILRIAKENFFSGLNNIAEYSSLDQPYSQHYGFTEPEVQELFQSCDLDQDMQQIKLWYNGYFSGSTVVYNPWSIMRCLSEHGKIEPYWVNTANNELLKKILVGIQPEVRAKVENLMNAQLVTATIDKFVSFQDINSNETALWSLLLFSGYLKPLSLTLNHNAGLYVCSLAIPNQEVLTLYNRYFKEWFQAQFGSYYEAFLVELINGNVKRFTLLLGDYLLHATSIHDFSRYPEAFYQGLVLGLIASLRESHLVHSNRESGFGFYDLLITPRADTAHTLGIILELKYTQAMQDLRTLAQNAVAQIDSRHYEASLNEQRHIRNILKVGLAFSSKSVVACYSELDLTTGRSSELGFCPEFP